MLESTEEGLFLGFIEVEGFGVIVSLAFENIILCYLIIS